jgi:hypothetical protein
MSNRSQVGLVVLLVCLVAACGNVKNNNGGTCGDGDLADTEECDEGTDNGQLSSCCSSDCKFVAAASECRPAQGACDKAESCTGSSGACPADEALADGAPCTGGNGVGVCSNMDTCNAGQCKNNDHPIGMACGQNNCDLNTCDAVGVCAAATGLKITIVESQSGPGGAAQNMDLKWKVIADGLGNTSTIEPQTILDNINNLATTDILIVSAFDIPIPVTRRNVISAFATSGRGVYIQGEFQATFEGNIVFEATVDSLGANFTWGASTLNTATASAIACFATTPFPVVQMAQNASITGSAVGAGLRTLEVDVANNSPIAFSFCRQGGGLVLTTTDKDNIRAQSAGVPELMKNIIYKLSYAKTCNP